MGDTIHIVCLDAPSPPDYGGAIDMFYKIEALHQIGKKIILHYFDYRSGRNADALEKSCAAIYRYKRKTFWRALPLSRPYIVSSRENNDLIRRLNQDHFPVLLEGIHCAGIIPGLNNKQRAVIRLHNEEASYYEHLAETEKKWLNRLYLLQESRLLERYQKDLEKDIPLACLSQTDLQVMGEQFCFNNLSFVPCFLPWQDVRSQIGRGGYCLYHGNMSVPENNAAAHWLIDHVFSKMRVPLVIAGNGIDAALMKNCESYPNVRLINNPSIAAIDDLVRNAHVHVLPSLNNTGVKLKLLNALLNGRFCVANNKGVSGSKIESGIVVKENGDEWVAAIQELMTRSFTPEDKNERYKLLALYDNRKNAKKLSALW